MCWVKYTTWDLECYTSCRMQRKYSDTSDKGHSGNKRTNLPTTDKPEVLLYTHSIENHLWKRTTSLQLKDKTAGPEGVLIKKFHKTHTHNMHGHACTCYMWQLTCMYIHVHTQQHGLTHVSQGHQVSKDSSRTTRALVVSVATGTMHYTEKGHHRYQVQMKRIPFEVSLTSNLIIIRERESNPII